MWLTIVVHTDFTPTVSNNLPRNKKNRTSLIVEIFVGAGFISFLSVFVALFIVKRGKKSQMNDNEGNHFLICCIIVFF